jgi:hypothetical protein
MAVRTRSGKATAGHAIMVVTGIIVGFIVLSIILVLVGANQGNMIVDFVLDVGRWLTTPFHNLFLRPSDTENLVINWGIAAVVYFAIGSALARAARWGD